MIWLQASPDPSSLPAEQEVGLDDLVETLPPNGYFHPKTWLYEQICLALPQRQICDPNCGGIDLVTQDDKLAPKNQLSIAVGLYWASCSANSISLIN